MSNSLIQSFKWLKYYRITYWIRSNFSIYVEVRSKWTLEGNVAKMLHHGTSQLNVLLGRTDGVQQAYQGFFCNQKWRDATQAQTPLTVNTVMWLFHGTVSNRLQRTSVLIVSWSVTVLLCWSLLVDRTFHTLDKHKNTLLQILPPQHKAHCDTGPVDLSLTKVNTSSSKKDPVHCFLNKVNLVFYMTHTAHTSKASQVQVKVPYLWIPFNTM